MFRYFSSIVGIAAASIGIGLNYPVFALDPKSPELNSYLSQGNPVADSEALSSNPFINTISGLKKPEFSTSSSSLGQPIKASSAVMVKTVAGAGEMAQINDYANGRQVTTDSVGQVTSVSQLSDVQPKDWAFQALQSLVERYGCIAGYPNRTFRGNRPLTRYEFAAGLNACMDRVQELLVSATGDLIKKEDLDTLKQLQEQFAAELATLRGRVDSLEARTRQLEAQQFSTTTKLNASVIFGLVGVATGQDSTGRDLPRNPTFGDRVRLNFDTSFTGKDRLRTRLQASNFNYVTSRGGTVSRLPEGALAFDAEIGDDPAVQNEVVIDTLSYEFPIGKKTRVYVFANEGEPEDFLDTVNPFLDGDEGDRGALSKFASRNSIYYFAPSGAGFAISHRFFDQLEVSAGYLSNTAAIPIAGQGLFNGSYAGIAQITLKLSDRFKFAFTYVNSYTLDDDLAVPGTGSKKANLSLVTNVPAINNVYGLEASIQVTPYFYISGWGTYAVSRLINYGDAKIWSYAGALTFPDLGRRGNLAGIIVGMEPKVTAADASIIRAFRPSRVEPQNRNSAADRDTSIHVEAFYTFAVNNFISITPGVIWLTAPNHDARNSGIVTGVIRTTFLF